MRKFELPIVSRHRFDQVWRENVELRQALKNANEERRMLKLALSTMRSKAEGMLIKIVGRVP